uniref:NEDD8-activating enzyme E1 catalytic subunit n=1 Tax=Lepeophtheirus salmonis TaxID=72036 RepID=A0A0K2TM46_LEPSM
MSMEVDTPQNTEIPNRWSHVKKLLERRGPFCHANFEPSPEILKFLQSSCRLLVIGAGGLGCELLKNVALMGFKSINVIDMDTIDVSNLNRQFLFRATDVGKFKAEAAAEFINKRIKGAQVIPHNKTIQEFDESFYRQFHIILCGLDSIVARRWINGMVVSLLEYDDDGSVIQSSVIPIIDGGTEGFKGNARVILPGLTACIECTLDLYPPQLNFPLCTIAHTPRLPEHCIEYVKVLLWPKENPFDALIDGDDPAHISWIHEKSMERASQYNIQGLTYRLTQGVVKRIIPAVASTNAVIAAVCALETFKLATSCCNPLQNYLLFSDSYGIYTYAYEQTKNDNCLACSQRTQKITISSDVKLQALLNKLIEDYRMKSPGVTTMTKEGKNKTLYMPNVTSIEEATRPNLKKSLLELGMSSECEIIVADPTSPNSMIFQIIFEQ